MAEWLRNPEVRLQTGIHGVLLVTAAAAAAIIWDIGCALYAAALCLAGSGISLWFTAKRYDRLSQLSREVDRVLYGNDSMAGIPVILSDRQMDVDESLYECWVGGNFIKEGETAGNWLADYLKAQGRDGEDINIVTLQGTIGASAQVGRTEGFGNILKQHDNWKMLDMQTGEFTQAKGQEVMESFLKSYDDIDVVVAENDNMAFGAIDAIKAAGKTCGPDGDIIIFSFDAVKAAFDAMIAGDLNAAFECNPLHGPRVDEIIKKLEKGETVEKIQYVDEAYFDTSMDLESIKAERAY